MPPFIRSVQFSIVIIINLRQSSFKNKTKKNTTIPYKQKQKKRCNHKPSKSSLIPTSSTYTIFLTRPSPQLHSPRSLKSRLVTIWNTCPKFAVTQANPFTLRSLRLTTLTSSSKFPKNSATSSLKANHAVLCPTRLTYSAQM